MAGSRSVKLFEFVVEGRGEFPFDMLRYDSCWPYSGEDAAKLYHRENLTRTVKLQTISEAPTKERWESFMWRVLTP